MSEDHTMIGRTFGRLTVLSQLTQASVRRAKWSCVCTCGVVHEALGSNLLCGYTKSCGCLRRELASISRSTHGRRRTSPIYGIWAGIKKRCTNPKDKFYHCYGGRGIKRCSRWDSFAAFELDMLPTYSPGMTLERKNVHGDYCPDNCLWIPMSSQSKNCVRTVRIQTPDGEMCAKDAVRRYGTVSYECLRGRLKLGWDPWVAVTTPAGVLGSNVVRVLTPDGVTPLAHALKKFGVVRHAVASVRIGDGWDPWKAITTPFPKPKEI